MDEATTISPTQTSATEAWAEAAAASAEATNDHKRAAKPPRSFTEKMLVDLTEKDLAERAAKLADHFAESDRLEDERKNTNDGFKARIALEEQSIRELAGVCKAKKEMRDVELIEEFVFATNTVRVTRADTKALVRERAMTRAERQAELPLVVTASPKDSAEESNADVSETDVTEPQTLLDGAAPDEEEDESGEEEPAPAKRGRRGKKG